MIYISGPMSGLPDHNFPAFNIAAVLLRRAGYEVLNPAELEVDERWGWEMYLRRDIVELMKCDSVALLRNWEFSQGAALEVHIARQLRMPCYPVEVWLHE